MDELAKTLPIAGAVRWLKVGLVLWLVTAIYMQLDLGLADQGDFLRAASWCTSAPVGLPQWPDVGSPHAPTAILQLLPSLLAKQPLRPRPHGGRGYQGRELHHTAVASRRLDRPAFLLRPRAVHADCLAASAAGAGRTLFALFAWIDASPERHKLTMHLLLGIPLVALLSTTDYLIFFNSFFQETGSLVYLIAWIASLVYLKRHPRSLLGGALSLAALILLVCAKLSNVYWVAVGLPLLVFFWRPWPWPKWQIVRLGVGYVVLGGVVFAAYFTCGRYTELVPHHHFNSLFSGILPFSRDPSTRLNELGLSGAEGFVGKCCHTPEGQKFLASSGSRLSYLLTLRVAWAEPAAMLRMLKYTADNMQDLSSDDLGRRAVFDPLAAPLGTPPNTHADCNPCERRWWDPKMTTPLNLWAYVKFRAFPTGYRLLLAHGCLRHSLYRLPAEGRPLGRPGDGGTDVYFGLRGRRLRRDLRRRIERAHQTPLPCQSAVRFRLDRHARRSRTAPVPSPQPAANSHPASITRRRAQHDFRTSEPPKATG